MAGLGYGARYGELPELFRRADLVVVAKVMRRGDDCPDPIRMIPGPGYINARTGNTSGVCSVTLDIVHSYKGTASQSEITASYSWTRSPRYQPPYAFPDNITLTFLCNSDSGLTYCPDTASTWIVSKTFAHNDDNQTGLNAIYDDVFADLPSEEDYMHLGAILWALGVGDHAKQLKAARQRSTSLRNRTFLDACLIQADDIDDGVIADIKQVSVEPMPQSGFGGNFIWSITNSRNPRILDLTPIMIKSNTRSMDDAVLTLIDQSRDSKYAAIIAFYFSDDEPGQAFQAMNIMEHLTGNKFADRPAFWRFVKDPAIRSAYTKEWQQWWQENRHNYPEIPSASVPRSHPTVCVMPNC